MLPSETRLGTARDDTIEAFGYGGKVPVRYDSQWPSAMGANDPSGTGLCRRPTFAGVGTRRNPRSGRVVFRYELGGTGGCRAHFIVASHTFAIPHRTMV